MSFRYQNPCKKKQQKNGPKKGAKKVMQAWRATREIFCQGWRFPITPRAFKPQGAHQNHMNTPLVPQGHGGGFLFCSNNNPSFELVLRAPRHPKIAMIFGSISGPILGNFWSLWTHHFRAFFRAFLEAVLGRICRVCERGLEARFR